MLKIYFRTSLRYLWKNRLFTILNVLGLSIGISACWMIFVIGNYESRFNKDIPDGERVFQVVSNMAGVPRPMVEFVKQNIPGAELIVPMHLKTMHDGQGDVSNALIDDPQKQVATNQQYFDLVPYQWLTGNKLTALDAPNKVVLTQSRANQYFPGMDINDIHGRTVLYNDTVPFIISGIVADLPYESSFEWQEFFRVDFSDDHWLSDSWNAVDTRELLYIKLKPHTVPEQVTGKIDAENRFHNQENFEKYKYSQTYKLLPLPDFHYASDVAGMPHRTVDREVWYGLMGIVIFLIVLAIINYINLSTAQLPQRRLEIGIRKTLGSSPHQLTGRFLIETLIISLIAALLSFVLSEIFFHFLADFMPPGISLYDQIGIKLFFMISLITVTTIIAGLYPAWLVTRIRTVNILKQRPENFMGSGLLSFRKALVVFQFVIAMIFISCSIIIGQQLRFVLNKDLGFRYDAVVSINVPERIHQKTINSEKPLRFKQALEQHPEISSISIADLPMESMLGHTTFFSQSDTGKIEVSSGAKYIDEDYLSVFGMKLLAGNNINPTNGISGYILNKAAVQAFGFDSSDDAIGKQLFHDPNSETPPVPIVGVVSDFHQQHFSNQISPIVLMFGYYSLRDIHIKLASADPKDWGSAINKIETEWKKMYPDAPFEYHFYDEVVSELYIKEQQTSTLVNAATTITIFISCLGLFGLATLMAFQRTKEIGIRKILGASISGIVAMLSKDFVKLVLIAIIIASPIAWWAMNKWLEDFIYRIDIQWWMFAVASLVALIIALFTVSWQALRAAVANPVDSLRDD